MEQSARQHETSQKRPRRATRAGRASASVEPTFASRFECKYLIDPMVISELRGSIGPFVEPDAYARRRPGYRYAVSSLYLDSESLLTYRQTVGGDRNRFKIRVRTYDDDPTTPAFFEVKRKIDTIVSKRRAALPREIVTDLLRTGYSERLDELRPGTATELDHVMSYVRLIEARPMLRVKYMREAYQATGNEPARITIDTELCHAVTFDEDLAHAGDRWVRTPVDGAILEIKFTERFPFWIHDLVQRFGLRQQAVPKYVMSLDETLGGNRISAMGIDGGLLPPAGDVTVDGLMRALEGSDRWFGEPTLESILLSLLLAFVLGQAIAWIYAWTHSGLSYSRSFTQSLVLMTLVVSLVMAVIGNNIVTAFGLLGALALIRFRNVLKDTRDTVFVFIALVIGMAVGSHRFLIAILGTIALGLVAVYLSVTSFGTLGRFDGYLTCRVDAPAGSGAELLRLLHRFCRTVKRVSTRQTGDDLSAELVYQVGLRDRERGGELLVELRDLEGVKHASLVLRNELSEV